MWPESPLDLRIRMYLAGNWRDVADDVRLAGRSEVVVTSGQAPESSRATPASCALELKNPGTYSPLNVLGPWYGELGVNTPVDAAIGWAGDDFDRTAASGWGTSTSGHVWSRVGGSASDFSVSAGVGRHSIGAADVVLYSYLDGLALETVDVAVTVSVSESVIAGGSVRPGGLMLRGQGGDYYLVQVSLTTSGAVVLAILHSDGTVLVPSTAVPGLAYTGQALRVRALIEGETVFAKVWPAEAGEPYAWQATASDATISGSGWVGVRSAVAAGNSNTKPITFEYSDLEVRLPLFAGELGKLPTAGSRHPDVAWARVTAAGITRRLGQGAPALQSAPRRYIPTSDPGLVAYVPCEDGELARHAVPVVGRHPAVLVSPHPPRRQWSHGDLSPWLAPGVALLGGDELRLQVTMPGQTPGDVEWAVDHVRSGEVDDDTQLVVHCADGQTWQVLFERTPDTAGGTATVITPTNTGTPFAVPNLWDGLAHHVRLFVEQFQPTYPAWYVDVDAVPLGSGSAAPTLILTPPTVARVVRPTGTNSAALAVAHLAVYGASRPLADFASPVLGRSGEPAGRRIERLCHEEGIPFVSVGDLDDTESVGPQRVASVLELIRDAAAADGGILGEPRGVVGLWYRTRRSLSGTPPVLELDYATRGHVVDLDLVDDDRLLRNHWTITRRHGSAATAELTTGRNSTAPPPAGVGLYDDAATLDLDRDQQCLPIAQQGVHLGTAELTRYDLTLQVLAAPELLPHLLALPLGGGVTVAHPPIWCGPDTIDQQTTQVIIGIRKSAVRAELTGRPARPWSAFELDTDHLDTDDTELVDPLTALPVGSADTLTVATGVLWSTDPADRVPELVVAGERMTVTAVTGTSSPQTITVLRGANGITKPHPAGTPIVVSHPAHLLR
jgi:hypothetical protein